jgi:putative phage-type endonuclease
VTAQRTPEWYEERREAITSTDIPIILGLSPYKSEAALAREKAGTPDAEPVDLARERLMRLGLSLEAVVRSEEEIEHGIKLRRVNRLMTHPTLPWARTSLDFERVGERTIVEAKTTRAGRWDDGLPQDVEAQVRWQLGVTGYPRAHIAVLRSGSTLECFDVEHDPATFDGLVVIAEDFRRRLAEGGPFAENAASVKARYPADNGGEMVADTELADAVLALVSLRAQRKDIEQREEVIETAIKSRMGEVATLIGQGFRVTWKRTKDSETVDWKSVADGLLRQLPEPERTALVGIATTVRPGFRPFRVVTEKEKE